MVILVCAMLSVLPACLCRKISYDSKLKNLKNVNIRIMSDDLLPPLLMAAESGDTQLVECLLLEGQDINTRNVFGMNCLHVAANRGHYDLVDYLSRDPVFVNSVCVERESVSPCGIYDGYTALHFNSYNGNLDIARLLISRGASINTKERISGRTPLLIAVENGRIELVKILLRYGAEVHVRDKHGNTALHIATENRCSEIIEIFEIILQSGVNIDLCNRRGNTALHIACKKNKSKIVKLLLENHCNVNVKNKNGKTPLYNAVEESSHIEIVRTLLENGANCNICDINGDTPFHIACKKNNMLQIELFLRQGCNVNAQNKDNFTALHFAVKFYYKNVVDVLLRSGVSVDCKTKHGETALSLALETGGIDVGKMLMTYGADIHIRNKTNCTLLHCAVSRGSFNVVQLVLKRGVDFNAVDNCRRTALDFALESRNTNIAKFLLDYGCDVNIMKSEFIFPTKYFMYCKSIAVIFLKHIIKLKTIGRFVSEDKLGLLNTEPLKSSFNICAFQEECVKEMAIIKNIKIENTCISLYDFLKKDLNQLAMCLKNDDVANASNENYKFKLPVYGNMIRLQFEKGFVRKSILESTRKYFDMAICNLPILPSYCVEIIVSHLSNSDLQALTYAFDPTKTNCVNECVTNIGNVN